MKIAFLRHAQSLYNQYNTSDKNCDLSEIGKKQAQDLSGSYDIVICSIMKRAKRTLELSKIHYNTLIFSELCREYKSTIGDFLEHEDYELELIETFGKRLNKFKEYLKENFETKNVLVICHGDFIYCLNGFKEYPENAQVQIIDI